MQATIITPCWKLRLEFLIVALIALRIDAKSQQTFLSYDRASRLTKVVYDTKKVIDYSYDNDGNRTSKQNYDNPVLQVNVGLQADMQSSGTMRNDLQNYFSGNSGLLPLADPYGLGQTYTQINNPLGSAGTVVDWVKVVVRSATAPSTIYQSRALLLKPNGAIVDSTGSAPRFDARNFAVRISIAHRNHLSILSNSISSLSPNATVSYNFTSSLSQASNDYSDPVQMVQVGGKWCMWAGDVNTVQDLFVDNIDFLLTRTAYLSAPFDVYNIPDLNMDGTVDNTDFLIQRLNYQLAVNSTLSNY